jgi:hypothetical protein
MKPQVILHRLTAADAIWIATAMLHHEHPTREDFRVDEIVEAAIRLDSALNRSTLKTHISSHCVAVKQKSPNCLRMLTCTGRGTYRLFREGDPHHPERTGRVCPERKDIASEYHYLLDWYEGVYSPPRHEEWLGGLRALIGSGRELWAGEDPDEYVRKLREDWD